MTARRVVVVRHAWAGVRGTWPGPDLERPLDPTGEAQADALVDHLATGATALASSQARRCRDTLAPLGTATGHDVVDVPVLLEGTAIDDARAWLAAQPDGTVACTHGDVLRGLLEQLVVEQVLADDDVAVPKGGWWTLTVDDDGRVTAAVGTHPPVVP